MKASMAVACALAAFASVAVAAPPASGVEPILPTGTEKVTISLSNNRTLPGACVFKLGLSSGVPDTYYSVSRTVTIDGFPQTAVRLGRTNSRGSFSETLGNALKVYWATTTAADIVVSIVDISWDSTPIPTATVSVRNRCTP